MSNLKSQILNFLKAKSYPPAMTSSGEVGRGKLKANRGFSLLESLVAIFVLTLASLGPLTLASYAIRTASLSQNRITAFYLAQEAMEYIRNRRDNNAIAGAGNWLNGLNSCASTNGCSVDIPNDLVSACSGDCPKIKYNSSTGLYNQTSGADTLFTRQVQLTQVANNVEEKVAVTISWRERFSNQSFTLEENIFNWR